MAKFYYLLLSIQRGWVMGKLRHLLLSIQRGRNEGERMAKLRHLLSSVQRGGVLVSFFICCRRSRERVRVREWESIVIFVVHSAGLG